VHVGWVVAFDEVDRVAVTFEYGADLVVRGTPQDGGVGNLIAVEVQDRQDRSVASRVEEADGLPGALQRSGLRLAVADHGGDEEVGVVEGGAESVDENVAELAALVYRAGSGHAHVARHPAGCRELPEEPPHPGRVSRDLRVDLGVGAFEVHVRQDGRTAVTRPRQVDHLGVLLPYKAVEVGIDEAEAGGGTPVPEEARLYVRRIQRLMQERVVLQVDLAHSEVVCGLPVAVHLIQQIVGERSFHRPFRDRRRGFYFDHAGDGRVKTVHVLLLSA
jgi:hypothetical protein